MSGFLYGGYIQFKMTLRDKDMLIFYYVVPLIFYLFMGGVFTSIMPDAYKTIIQTMTVFGITMGGILGAPYPLVEIFRSDIKKSYQVAHVPLYTLVLSNFLSAYIHLSITSLIIYFSAPYLFDALLPSEPIIYFVSFQLFLVTTLLAGSVFGLYVKSISKLTMMTQLLFLPSIILSGIMFPIELLPAFLQKISLFLPATHGAITMNQATFSTSSYLSFITMIFIFILLLIFKLRTLKNE